MSEKFSLPETAEIRITLPVNLLRILVEHLRRGVCGEVYDVLTLIFMQYDLQLNEARKRNRTRPWFRHPPMTIRPSRRSRLRRNCIRTGKINMPDLSSLLASMPPGSVDPDEYAQLMRAMQLAPAITQMALTPAGVQQPQGSNRGFYQEARVNPLSGLAKLAEAYIGRKSMDTANTGMAKMYAEAMQSMPTTYPGMPGASGSMPASPPAGPPGASPDLSPASGGGGTMPINPMGAATQRALLRLYITDPQKWLDQIKGTPEWQTALAANNGDVTATQASLRAEMAKKGTLENRAGGETGIPDATAPGGYRWLRTPTMSPDMMYDRDAQGNITGAQNIPGAVPALAAQKGAQTGAEFANTGHLVPMGGGVERFMYGADALGTPPALRGPQAPSTPALPSLGQAPGTASPSPSAVPGTSGMPTPPAKSYFGPPPAPHPMPAAPTAPQGAQLPQKDQNGIFSNNLWANPPKMVIPQSPGQTSDTYSQGILGAAVAKHAELVNKFGEQAALGAQSQGYYQEALKQLPAAEVGPMSEYLTHNRSLLMQMVPSLKNVLGDSGTVTPTLELNKNLKNAALQGAKATYGRLTQMEVRLQTEEMSPSATMTRDAIAALIRQNMMRSSYQIQQNKDYSEYHQTGGDPMQFEAQYNVRRPVTRFAAQYDTPQPALDRLKQQPQTLPDFKAKFGWDPTQ
jgi:hypothetical protein